MSTIQFVTFNENVETLNTRCMVFWKPDAICTCWSYTAKYTNSSRFYRVGGGGVFPKSLRVPQNVDVENGKMIDEGELINPNKYKVTFD